MKYLAILVLCLGVPSLVICEDAAAANPDAEACKAMAKQYFKRIHKVYMDCHADVKKETSNLDELFEKFGCTVKCILKADKMLNENDLVTEDLMKATSKDRVTPKYEEKLLAKFMKCKTDFGDKLDKNDDKCLSYKKYGLCMQEALSHVCYE